MELDILGSAESLALTVSRLPGGKFSVRSDNSQIETVILADRVLAAAFRPEAGPSSSLTQIELPSPRSRHPKPTTSETCSRREVVSLRLAVTSLHVTETLLRRAVTSSRVGETSLLHDCNAVTLAETP
jgi:hypothetical protein